MSCPRRIIAGTSGSLGNLSALRHAEDLAHACDAAVIPVHTWSRRAATSRSGAILACHCGASGPMTLGNGCGRRLPRHGTAPLRFSLRSADDCRRGSPAFPACDR
jgi:hypothetical protein